jgi:hypothetical protein
LLIGLGDKSPKTAVFGILLRPVAEYDLPELLRALILRFFPAPGVVPAHVDPMPRATLAGDFKTRPHFLHLACSSIAILLDKIHQPRRWIWAGVA